MLILTKIPLSGHFTWLWKLFINSKYLMAVADTCKDVAGWSFLLNLITWNWKNASFYDLTTCSSGYLHFISYWILNKLQQKIMYLYYLMQMCDLLLKKGQTI